MKALTKKQLGIVREKILNVLYPLPIQKVDAEDAADTIVRFLSRLKRPQQRKRMKKGNNETT